MGSCEILHAPTPLGQLQREPEDETHESGFDAQGDVGSTTERGDNKQS